MDQRTALVRVRALAGLSAGLGSLKLLPAVDALVLAVEWLGLKTALPIAWELIDAWRERRLSLRTVAAAPLTANWVSLIAVAFGGAAGTVALTADVGTDASSLLPPPLDGFDVPPMLADAALAFFAHRALVEMDRAGPLPGSGGACVSGQRRAPSLP